MKKSTDKFESKLQKKIRKTFLTLNSEMDFNIVILKDKIGIDFVNTILESLITVKDKENKIYNSLLIVVQKIKQELKF